MRFFFKKAGKSSLLVLLFDYFLVVASHHRVTLGLVIDGRNAISLAGRIYLSDVARWTRRSTYFSGKYSWVGRWIRQPRRENFSPFFSLDDSRCHSNDEGHDTSSWGKDENWIRFIPTDSQLVVVQSATKRLQHFRFKWVS